MEVEQVTVPGENGVKSGKSLLLTENVQDASEKSLETRTEKQQQHDERNGGGGNQKTKNRPRKKHRRGAKKKPRQKYKPYNKLTWDEKRKLDEKDALKAVRRREELVAQKGRPIAPYNTTQFLMEEHDPGDENLQNSNQHTTHSSTSSTEGNNRDIIDNEESSSSYSSDEYFEKDFDEFYERIHIDTLNSYTKEDLIKNVYELERRIEVLEKENNKIDMQQLKDENQRLTKENEALREKVSKIE